MIQSPGDRKRLLLAGASGTFGTKFIELFASKFEIIALTNANPVVGSNYGNLTLFDPVSGTRTEVAVREVKCDLLDSAAVRSTINTITECVGPINYLVNAAADVRFLGSTFDIAEFEAEAAKQWKLNLSNCSLADKLRGCGGTTST